MRSFTSLATVLLLSLCAAGTLSADVSTIPVGFYTVTVPAATDATHPSNTVVSVAFYQVAKFQGAISSVDGPSQVSFSGTTLTTLLTTPPYLARFKTGASAGRFFVITGNTDTQVTLDTSNPTPAAPNGAGYTLTTSAPSNTQAQVAVGDSVEILPANTLGSLFGTTSVPFKTNTDPNVADNIFLFNGTSYDLYYHNGTNWRKSGNLGNQNNTVVLPDRGIFITRRDTTGPVNLTFLGTVPSSTERTDFPGPGSTFKSTRFPVDMILGSTDPNVHNALNLQNLPNWIKNTDPNVADNVYLWNGTGWDLYYHNNTNWRKSGNLTNQNGKVIPIGQPIFVQRKSSASGNQSTLVISTLPYTL